jgi:alpha-tubulin suppressor-like RCC1 family protein
VIVDIAIGTSAAFALDNMSNVWAWGLNTSGEFGIGTRNVSGTITDPAAKQFPEIIDTGYVYIAASGNVSARINTLGQCLTAGSNAGGFTGQGTNAGFTITALPVALSGTALSVRIGQTSILFILSNGNLMGCGIGSTNYSLGAAVVASGVNPTAPVAIPDFGGQIQEVACGVNQTWVRNSTGQMLLMGSYNATLGGKGDGTLVGTGTLIQTVPNPVLFPVGVTCGKLVSQAGDTLCIGSDQQIYVWGSNARGVFGLGTADTNPHPTPQPLANLQLLGAGQVTTATGMTGILYCGGPLPPPFVFGTDLSNQVIG